MDAADGVKLLFTSSLRLAPQVVLGTIDIAAAGARALWSLQPPEDWSVREIALGISGADGPDAGGKDYCSLRPVLNMSLESPAAAAAAAESSNAVAEGQDAEAQRQHGSCTTSAAPLVVVRNMYGPSTPAGSAGDEAIPQVSLVILNVAVPEGDQAELAAALLDLITERGPPAAAAAATAAATAPGSAADVAPLSASSSRPSQAGHEEGPGAGAEEGRGEEASVCLAAAMLMPQAVQPAALHQHLLNGAQPLAPGLPALPTGPAAATTRVRDGQLAALLHVMAVSGTPTCCLLAPGYKPPASTPLDLPGSLPACDALGAALASALGLQYDAAKCRTTHAQYKWFVPEKTAGSDVMYC